MNVSFKVGSVVHVPAISGLSVSSSDPTVISLAKDASGYVATAIKIGTAMLSVHAGSDVMGVWIVSVVA
jgi:hypothetical protein